MSATDIIIEIQRWPESERERLYRLLVTDESFRKVIDSGARARPPLGEGQKPLSKLAALAGSLPANPNMPADAAAQHDHYLYGTSKKA